jgi:type I site-specific restriction-modification system R (restriction) subunit
MFIRDRSMVIKLRAFLQLTSHELKIQNNTLLIFNHTTKAEAMTEAYRISELLGNIDSEDALRVIEDGEPTPEISALENEIADLTINAQDLLADGANTENAELVLAEKREQLNHLLTAHIEIDLKKIKNLEKLIFINLPQETAEDHKQKHLHR